MKKTIAALTALLSCALLAVPCSAADIRYVRGDADRDGVVTIKDATAIQRKLAQFSMSGARSMPTASARRRSPI